MLSKGDCMDMKLLEKDRSRVVSLEVIEAQKTFKDALRLCKSISGVDDKEIFVKLDIDQAQWSRIFTGAANFPENKLLEYMEICNNKIPLIWLAVRCGYVIQPRKNEYELEIDRLKEELIEIKMEREKVIRFLQDKDKKYEDAIEALQAVKR
jgi:hypothetical protein